MHFMISMKITRVGPYWKASFRACSMWFVLWIVLFPLSLWSCNVSCIPSWSILSPNWSPNHFKSLLIIQQLPPLILIFPALCFNSCAFCFVLWGSDLHTAFEAWAHWDGGGQVLVVQRWQQVSWMNEGMGLFGACRGSRVKEAVWKEGEKKRIIGEERQWGLSVKMLKIVTFMLVFSIIWCSYALYLIFQGVPKPSRTAFYFCAHRHWK